MQAYITMHISIVPAPWGGLKRLSFFFPFNLKCVWQYSSEIELHCQLFCPTVTNPDINIVPASLQVLLLSNTSLPFSKIMDSLGRSSLSQIALPESFYSFFQSSYRQAASMKLSHKQSLWWFPETAPEGPCWAPTEKPSVEAGRAETRSSLPMMALWGSCTSLAWTPLNFQEREKKSGHIWWQFLLSNPIIL